MTERTVTIPYEEYQDLISRDYLKKNKLLISEIKKITRAKNDKIESLEYELSREREKHIKCKLKIRLIEDQFIEHSKLVDELSANLTNLRDELSEIENRGLLRRVLNW